MGIDATVIPRTNNVNALVDNITTAVNGSGQIEVKDAGISTIKIIDNAVTFAKLEPKIRAFILMGLARAH